MWLVNMGNNYAQTLRSLHIRIAIYTKYRHDFRGRKHEWMIIQQSLEM